MSLNKVSSPMIESGTKGADIASAATVVIGTDGSYFDITGTTGISTQFTVDAGRRFTLQFDGAVVITDNAAITLAGAANFTTAAGDILSFVATAANTVVQTGYSLVDGGSPVAPAAGGGITQASAWRLTANLTGTTSNSDITANLEEDDSTGSGIIGSSMTESSGIFTFPATGFWWVMVHAYMGTDSPGTANSKIEIFTTTNDSTYVSVVQAQAGSTSGGGEYTHASGSTIFDVTSTSNCKVKFQQKASQGSGSEWKGTTTVTYTGFIFVRLGDT